MPEPTIWTGSLSVPDLGQRLITYCLDIPPPQATASCFDEVKGSGCIVSQVLEKTPKSLIPLGLTGWVRRRGGGFLTGSHVYRQIGWKVYQETSALEISVKKKKKKKQTRSGSSIIFNEKNENMQTWTRRMEECGAAVNNTGNLRTNDKTKEMDEK